MANSGLLWPNVRPVYMYKNIRRIMCTDIRWLCGCVLSAIFIQIKVNWSEVLAECSVNERMSKLVNEIRLVVSTFIKPHSQHKTNRWQIRQIRSRLTALWRYITIVLLLWMKYCKIVNTSFLHNIYVYMCIIQNAASKSRTKCIIYVR